MRHDDQTSRVEWIRAALSEFEGPLLRYTVRLTGNLEAARDVVQDTFLRLCRERPERLNSHLAEWLFTVCRHRALDLLRKDGRLTELTDADIATRSSPEPTPATVAADREAVADVLQALDGLPVNQREVIRLKFQNGLSYRQISRITQLSESNVGFLIHTGIKTLRRRVQALEGVRHET
jgi:RNA polymerase sigma-70 factor (ECF subfamily)